METQKQQVNFNKNRLYEHRGRVEVRLYSFSTQIEVRWSGKRHPQDALLRRNYPSTHRTGDCLGPRLEITNKINLKICNKCLNLIEIIQKRDHWLKFELQLPENLPKFTALENVRRYDYKVNIFVRSLVSKESKIFL